MESTWTVSAADRAAADQEIRPVLAQLADAGYPVEDVHLLVGYDDPSGYVPILCAWLPRLNAWLAKEWVVRALGVKAAAEQAIPLLIAEHEWAGDLPAIEPEAAEELRWAIGATLEGYGAAVPVGALVALLAMTGRRRSGQMVALALGTAAAGPDRATALAALPKVLADPVVGGHAVEGLANRRRRIAANGGVVLRPDVVPYLEDERRWVRTAAQRFLDVVDAQPRS